MRQGLFPRAPGYTRPFPADWRRRGTEWRDRTSGSPAILRHGCKTQILVSVGFRWETGQEARERATRERRHDAGNRGQYG